MSVEIKYVKDGVPLSGNVVNIALAGAANAVVIWTLSAAVARVGVTSVKLKKVVITCNAIGANPVVHIGTGVGGAFVDLVPAMTCIDNFDNPFDLNDVEAFANVTCFPAVMAAGTIDVKIWVDEVS